MKERPIIMQPESVLGILSGKKTMTRRVVKYIPDLGEPDNWCHNLDRVNELCGDYLRYCPYGVSGDQLYVKEKWRVGAYIRPTLLKPHYSYKFAIDYKADGYYRREWLTCPDIKMGIRLVNQCTEDALKSGLTPDSYGEFRWLPGESPCRWRSPLFMPRWASRIQLRNKSNRVERVQDISEEDAQQEGLTEWLKTRKGLRFDCVWPAKHDFREFWDSINAAPKPVKSKGAIAHFITRYESYPWEDIRETREHRGKPWNVIGNPLVWAIKFERI